ncbi:AAA family ATPase [Fibrobacter sp. UBA2449]|uniref:AAA family ATPase n=1 Tax=Fibrobacter sp. UBA2449 TaxID=1946529 RepID=UPI0025BF3158|nr:AAA family ATPase [Fibrobacter sp. UBA2449]
MKKILLNLVDYDKNGNPNLHGLNWGNRKDGTERDKNEAYLQLTPEIYNTDFFPAKGKYFIVETDDKETIIFVRAQKPIGTALQTPEDNAILGKYLRKRLDIADAEEITLDKVEAYRTTISFYKIDSLHYLLDYSKNDDVFNSANKSLPEKHSLAPVTPSQIIYYGVPGCGKSNKIREQLKDVPEKNKVRVVFHPEYTNAEFIGQILPKVNGHVTYEFTPGPFTQIIKRAYLNPKEHFYLVIEEINRGNAAAIFGDTFQLLDRLKAGETDSLGNDPANAAVNTFTEGWSQYFVQNDDVNAYIRGTENSIQIGNIRFDSNTAIRLPPNLSILATMNTSDQNVFTLDNAFQRRFDMELVRNEFDLTQPAVNAQYNAEIDDTGIKWGQFWGWINAKITATLKGLSSTEDKRLGVWFVSNVGGIIDDKVFAEKVLKFLWDDVFKFKRPQIFEDGIDTLEKLINSFEKPSEGKERFDVFKDKANLVAFVASPTL